MPSRRALLATLGTAVAAGCLGGGSTPTDATDSDSPTSAPTRSPTATRSPTDSPTETAPLTGKDPDCTTPTKLDENYDLAVVLLESRSTPVDLTVTVEAMAGTPLETPLPRTAVGTPDEPDDTDTPATETDIGTVYRERFSLYDAHNPRIRRDVFTGDTDFILHARAGDSGYDPALVRLDGSGDPAGVEVVVTRDGVIAGQVEDRRLAGTPCPR